jgi:hypothetical protein
MKRITLTVALSLLLVTVALAAGGGAPYAGRGTGGIVYTDNSIQIQRTGVTHVVLRDSTDWFYTTGYNWVQLRAIDTIIRHDYSSHEPNNYYNPLCTLLVIKERYVAGRYTEIGIDTVDFTAGADTNAWTHSIATLYTDSIFGGPGRIKVVVYSNVDHVDAELDSVHIPWTIQLYLKQIK